MNDAKRTANDEADRLMTLLDVGLQELRKGDGQSAILALQEALQTAERMPKKASVICLPDQSGHGGRES